MAGHRPQWNAGRMLRTRAQLVPEPALLQPLRVGVELGRLAAVLERVERRLGRDHARLHRGVGALDLGHVEEARRVADQRPAGEHQLRDRLEAALADSARAP